MNNYCSKCDKLSEIEIHIVEETFPVKGEKINIKSEVAFCRECNSQVFNEELDEKNLASAYELYRKQHNLLSVMEISDIREKYSLSQRSLSQLLEWGEVTITRYENGAIQDPAHNEVLLLLRNPRNMKEIFEKNGHMLPVGIKEKLAKRINELTSSEFSSKVRISIIEDCIAGNQAADEYSGFRGFDLDKMVNLIVYIAEKSKGVFTTKLNKLLWYADFLNFKSSSTSITGTTYFHLPLGPVPNDYEWIIAYAMNQKLLSKDEITYPTGISGEQYKALAPANQSIFSKDELNIVDQVLDYFKDYKCGQIKDRSHEEIAYKETKPQERISYKYALEIKLD